MRRKPIALAIALMPITMLGNQAQAQSANTLPEVEVTATRLSDGTKTPFGSLVSGDDLRSRRGGLGDSSRLLDGMPGVSLFAAGGVSSLPIIDGLGDDRLRMIVDGMDITSACPNHMNPAFSYIDPSAVQKIQVFAGITPVSMGGDSIGGTIVMQSASPEFARPGEGLRTSGLISGFYRSNGDGHGVNLRASMANENFSIAYSGSTVEAGNYKDGNGNIVRSTAFKSENHLLSLGTKFGTNIVSLNLGWQEIPYQGYPNQYMDMTSNKSFSFNLGYQGGFDWGDLEARAYRQRVRHKMDMLDDKANLGVLTFGSPYAMPMDTRAVDTGYSIKATIPLGNTDVVRIGHEYHHYTLDDWWPPIPGSMMMGPGTFWNINDGKRDRLALYSEWERNWNPAWTTQLGVRYERVTMNTGNVQGYYDNSMGMGFVYQNDADAFNARDHKKTDNNIDVTAVARYEPNSNSIFDFGFARKTRSPNIYERFAWSNESAMAGAMVNWFGDLNAYVGNLNLKPEVANTFRITADWHDAEKRDWQIKVAPFYTRVNNYINAITNPNVVDLSMMGMASTPAGRTALMFVNHDAELYGVDLTTKKHLGRAGGEWNGRVGINYVRGKDLDSGAGLYNVMPLNAKLALDHRLGNWANSLEFVAVASKSHVDTVRLEQKTAGYSLVNFRTSYTYGNLRVDAGINNLFDRRYDLPLGGLDYYKYNGLNAPTSGIVPVAGMGRSASVGLSLAF